MSDHPDSSDLERPVPPSLAPSPSPSVRISQLPHCQAHHIWQNCLYLGPVSSARDEAALRADGITHVLNVATQIDTQQFETVQVRHLRIYDSPQQVLPLEQATQFLAQALLFSQNAANTNKCLVHCYAGQSRSASLVIYFLLKYGNYFVKDRKDNGNDWSPDMGFSLQQAMEWVKSRKPDICPNFGFAAQLEQAERDLYPHTPSNFNLMEYKIDCFMQLLEGSTKTREDARRALERANGNGDLALDLLLES